MNTDLMTPAEVAALLRVDPKTVTRWAVAGKLRSIRTMGGHRRYYRADIEAHLAGTLTGAPVAPVHPCAVPERRDLEGRTFTVERLPEDVNVAPAEHFGKLAVISRLDGRFDEVALVAGDGDTAERMQTIADALAITCGLERLDARYGNTMAEAMDEIEGIGGGATLTGGAR